jgi:hypothetical protein
VTDPRPRQTLEQLLQYPRSVRALVIQHDFLRAPTGLVPRGTWRRVSATPFELVADAEVLP